MRLNKNLEKTVKVSTQNGTLLGFANCDSIHDTAGIKAKVRRDFQFNGTVIVEVSQENGYKAEYQVMTGAK